MKLKNCGMSMVTKIEIHKIICGFALLLVMFFSLQNVNSLSASKLPVDESVEESREYGTDLYEATKFHNSMDISIVSSDGTNTSLLKDEQYSTAVIFKEGTKLTVSSESDMDGIYIIWDCNVPEWTMVIDGEEYTYGENGFLHEYIKLPRKTTSLDIIIPNSYSLGNLDGCVNGMRISDIYAFDSDKLPSWVQTWKPTLSQADILVFSTHGDDEHIFFGGILPTYQAEKDVKVQYAYFTHHWVFTKNSKIREHEKLNGLWLAGAEYYPINGVFKDYYATSIAQAEVSTTMEDAVDYVTECIRRTHPQVVVTHDVAGEYGHGQHMLLSAATMEAVNNSNDDSFCEESAQKYGVWDVSKTYIHLYEDNQIKLDLRVPLEAFDGKTAIEVARQAYLCHESQQIYWFTVDDYGPYSNNSFGLYRTMVGDDIKKNDLMENLISYDEQERIAREEEERRLEEEKLLKEQEEKERLEREERLRIEEEQKKEAERLKAEQAELEAKKLEQSAKIKKYIGISLAIFLAIAITVYGIIEIRRLNSKNNHK